MPILGGIGTLVPQAEHRLLGAAFGLPVVCGVGRVAARFVFGVRDKHSAATLIRADANGANEA